VIAMKSPEDLVPVKTFTELMDAAKTRLQDMAFRITNLRPGGVFYTLLEMANQGVADLYELLEELAPQFSTDNATDEWLDLRAAEYEVYRKEARKTKGNLLFGRAADDTNVVIFAGTVVTTGLDRNGQRLQFFVTEQTVLEEGALEVLAPVEAEFAGAEYNVGTGLITHLMTYIPGIDYVTNPENWITLEGTDTEPDDDLRARTKRKWHQLSTGGTKNAYIAWAEEIPGVVTVHVDDNFPRGQGTVDVIITSSAGMPSQELVAQVQAHLDEHRPLCANVQVIAPTPLPVDIDVELYVHPDYGDLAEIESSAQVILDNMFQYGDKDATEIIKASPDYGVTRAAVISNLMTIEYVVNVVLAAPVNDVPVSARELAVKGSVHISVQRVSA